MTAKTTAKSRNTIAATDKAHRPTGRRPNSERRARDREDQILLSFDLANIDRELAATNNALCRGEIVFAMRHLQRAAKCAEQAGTPGTKDRFKSMTAFLKSMAGQA